MGLGDMVDSETHTKKLFHFSSQSLRIVIAGLSEVSVYILLFHKKKPAS